MGTWGTAILSDDLAADVRDVFTDFVAVGLDSLRDSRFGANLFRSSASLSVLVPRPPISGNHRLSALPTLRGSNASLTHRLPGGPGFRFRAAA
jgi:hypothetical protein